MKLLEVVATDFRLIIFCFIISHVCTETNTGLWSTIESYEYKRNRSHIVSAAVFNVIMFNIYNDHIHDIAHRDNTLYFFSTNLQCFLLQFMLLYC